VFLLGPPSLWGESVSLMNKYPIPMSLPSPLQPPVLKRPQSIFTVWSSGLLRSRGSSVGTAESYGMYGRGSIPGTARFFLLHSVQTGSGAHPASNSVGTGGSYLGVKRPGREADHSPSSSVEVKNGGAIPPLPHTSLWYSG
jgi:hypothetical protein